MTGILRRVPMALVRGYQLTLGRILPPACRFHPSCSNYALEAFQRFGVIRGGVLTVWRLARCTPLTVGGVDPVPLTFAFPPWNAGGEPPASSTI